MNDKPESTARMFLRLALEAALKDPRAAKDGLYLALLFRDLLDAAGSFEGGQTMAFRIDTWKDQLYRVFGKAVLDYGATNFPQIARRVAALPWAWGFNFK